MPVKARPLTLPAFQLKHEYARRDEGDRQHPGPGDRFPEQQNPTIRTSAVDVPPMMIDEVIRNPRS